MRLQVIKATRCCAVTVAIVGALTCFALPAAVSAQTTTYRACYVPQVGAMYLIGIEGLPDNCLSASHIEIIRHRGLHVGRLIEEHGHTCRPPAGTGPSRNGRRDSDTRSVASSDSISLSLPRGVELPGYRLQFSSRRVVCA